MERGWRRFLAGVLIGAAGIAPGVSGGVIAVSLGLYQPAIEALAGFARHARHSARYLAPLAAGVGAGLAVAGYVLLAFMDAFAVEAVYLFAGLVLGSLPALVRQGGWRARRLPLLMLGAAAYIALCRLLPEAGEAAALDLRRALGCGAVLALGTVVPGLSSSFLLMRLGLYPAYLRALGGLRMGELALIGAGFTCVAAATIHAADRLFARHASGAYMFIAGFTLASVVAALPPVGQAISPAACLMLMPLGAGAGLLMRGAGSEQAQGKV